MDEVSIRELSERVSELVNRAAAGERFSVTRHGEPVAQLVPARRPVPRLEALRECRRSLPALEPVTFRRDIDRVLDAEV
jgi:prevent-host-death family protein